MAKFRKIWSHWTEAFKKQIILQRFLLLLLSDARRRNVKRAIVWRRWRRKSFSDDREKNVEKTSGDERKKLFSRRKFSKSKPPPEFNHFCSMHNVPTYLCDSCGCKKWKLAYFLFHRNVISQFHSLPVIVFGLETKTCFKSFSVVKTAKFGGIDGLCDIKYCCY